MRSKFFYYSNLELKWLQGISPARVHLVRYYGLYSPRTKGILKDMPNIVSLAPEGFSSCLLLLSAFIGIIIGLSIHALLGK
jgi:hypothetical protein